MWTLKPPYLLFLGNAPSSKTIKMATSAVTFIPKDCIGFNRMPGCPVILDLPELSIKKAIEAGAKSFVIGLVNNGGYIEAAWLPSIIEAIEGGLDIISGMHEKLEDIILENGQSLGEFAKKHTVSLHNLRHTPMPLPIGNGEKRSGKRILTVGTDCGVGKMFTSMCLTRGLSKTHSASFVATGQCGILISNYGIAIDAVAADFISGAVEQLSPNAEPHHIYVIEGQGSLFHPAYAGVSLGLLHGAQPDYIVLCHEVGRAIAKNFKHTLPSLSDCLDLNLKMGRMTNPNTKPLGVSLNTKSLSENEARELIDKIADKLNLPVTDPYRFGVKEFVERL